ncbi:unnamed protein product [Prunus armeniaca]
MFVPHTSSSYGVQGSHSGSLSGCMSSGHGLLPTPTSHVGYSGNASSRPLSLSFGPRPVSHNGFRRGKFNGGSNFSSPTHPNFRGITPDYRGHNTFFGSKSNYSFQGQAPPSSLTAMTSQTFYSPEQVWIADSGATHHMVGDVSQLQHVTPCVTEENVTVGNGLTMPYVFHVPKLKANLLSVHQHCKDNNCYIVFDVSGFLIQDKVTHQVLLKGKSDHGLYPIPLLPQSTISSISSIKLTLASK